METYYVPGPLPAALDTAPPFLRVADGLTTLHKAETFSLLGFRPLGLPVPSQAPLRVLSGLFALRPDL